MLVTIPVVPGRAGGGSFRWKNTKKPISQRKNLPMECAQGHQPVRCPNRVCCVHQPSAVPPGVGVLVVAGCVSVLCWWWWCDVVWCRVFGFEVPWALAVWLVARCHLIWCCSMLCDVMWCHVMSCDVMWWGVWCDVMKWDGMLCDVMVCGCVMRWIGRWCETLETSVPMRGATLGCKTQDHCGEPTSEVLMKYYASLLQSATLVLVHGATYWMQNTPELLHSCLIIITHERPSECAEQLVGCKTHCNSCDKL